MGKNNFRNVLNAILSLTNMTPYCLMHGAGCLFSEEEKRMRSLQRLFVRLSIGCSIPLHFAVLFAVEIRLPVCTCESSLRAVGFAVTPASLLRGAGITRTVRSLLHFSWLRGHCGMCWAGILR